MVVVESAVVALGGCKRAGGVHDVIGKERRVIVHVYGQQPLLGRICVPSHVLMVLQQVIFVSVGVVVYGVGLAALVHALHASHGVAGLQLGQVQPSRLGALIACPSRRAPSYALGSVIRPVRHEVPVAHGG